MELEELKPLGSTSEEPSQPEQQEESSQTQTSTQDGQASDASSLFGHPLLKGKTPEEVERIFQAQQDALRAQNEELNRYHEQLRSVPQPPKVEEELDYGDDFLAPRFKTFEERVMKKLGEMVRPLVEEVHTRSALTVRERLSKELPHFKEVEPHIDRALREMGVDPTKAREDQLRTLYYTALGVAAAQGISLASAKETPVTVPQHRPSSAPLPPQSAPQPRPLTDEERRLARIFFPHEKDPEAAYRKYQEIEPDSIVNPGFSKGGW